MEPGEYVELWSTTEFTKTFESDSPRHQPDDDRLHCLWQYLLDTWPDCLPQAQFAVDDGIHEK